MKKGLIQKLNKHFDHRIRLGIMSVLMVNEWATFSELKDFLGATDGNLASHLKTLEREKYILIEKKFVARKPQTSYKVSPFGKSRFQEHLNALESLLNPNEK